jgi:diguanylate cyclase (GGDEF)-like protein/PAS domain S-box-containing protein
MPVRIKPPYLGLRTKLVLYLLLPSCLVIAAMIYIYNEDLYEAFHQKYVEEAILASASLQAGITSMETLQDRRRLQELIGKFLVAYPQYHLVNIYNASNQTPLILGSSDPAQIGKVPDRWDLAAMLSGKPQAHEEIRGGRKILETSVPVIANGKTVAVVGLYIPTDSRDVLINHLRSRILTVGPLGIIILLLMLYVGVNHLIVGPVRRLVWHTERVREGDYQVRVLVKGRDEVARLGEAFNKMAASLETARLSEEAKQEVFRKLSSVIEQTADHVLITDKEGFIEYVNPAFERLTGYAREETIGKTPRILKSGKHDQRFYEELWKTILSGGIFRGVVVNRKKNGELFYEEKTITPIRDIQGTIKYFVSTGKDITERMRVNKELEESFSLLRATLESTADGILVVDREGNIVSFNRKFTDMWRIPESVITSHDKEQMLAIAQEQLKDPESFLARMREAYVQADAVSFDTLEFKDGRMFEHYSKPQRIGGRSFARVWSFRDVTEQKQYERALQETNYTLQTLIQSSPLSIIALDPQGNVTMWNPAAERTFGWSKNEILGQFLPIVPEDKQDEFRGLLGRVLGGEALRDVEVRRLKKDGSLIDASVSVAPLKDTNGQVIGVVGVVADITERKRMQKALEEHAIRDALTGLYNRRYFNDRLEEEIAQAQRNRYTLALLLCDLDHFKTINDSQGHHAGDEVLRTVTKSIQESTRGTDLVFRWGGDEFVVLLSNTTREGILIATNRIRNGIRKIKEQARIDLDLSIGVALYPEHGRTVDELIHLADRALYIAKKGGDKVHIGEEDYPLTEGSITVVFQPIVVVQSTRDSRSNKLVGYEALSRDPEGKLSILQLFEKYRAIGKLHELKGICFQRQLKAAQANGLERVFINVDFQVLKEAQPTPKLQEREVILEISELEAIRDVENRLEIARRWRELGYKFAIDDFGAGFISLPFIARLMPEYIKMDRSTILQAVASKPFREFMIGLVFGLRNYCKEGIIAEGVETEKELWVVKEMGIHLVQGYLFGKPKELNTHSERSPRL